MTIANKTYVYPDGPSNVPPRVRYAERFATDAAQSALAAANKAVAKAQDAAQAAAYASDAAQRAIASIADAGWDKRQPQVILLNEFTRQPVRFANPQLVRIDGVNGALLPDGRWVTAASGDTETTGRECKGCGILETVNDFVNGGGFETVGCALVCRHC